MQGCLILGADPGLITTGLGLIEARGGHCFYRGSAAIVPPRDWALERRLEHLFTATCEFLATHRPACMVVEKLIHVQNSQVALKLGHARGVLLLAAARAGVPLVDYTPREVKLAVSGNGAASKEQIQRMVQAVLGMKELPTPHDIADGLALAICHAHRTLKPDHQAVA
ncbi:MAG: crossover junction endodeoxyribonuclease RuvC [candidate division KSB1 bacterium]|nr:crossover junction endodeoxyribonuclease RuvC [candidate division KSB1 bacterium]MDZ7276163.1 crossover junction endodeoxyribonuclease RuvC [candidate division KSB1 bacterium]MDZ7287057.1 crossover junction endodeoxyribonuclease RuvC [candidate division KSB1 bacterium]MDZ7297018.1 crossover junction endodeoxyribonuclease RuvC [candidate division KSB1 bacterium]MDZ7307524.1 crossover junction endodeoxyribonuclease RuvC [candidate division KSB1 bacterium]